MTLENNPIPDKTSLKAHSSSTPSTPSDFLKEFFQSGGIEGLRNQIIKIGIHYLLAQDPKEKEAAKEKLDDIFNKGKNFLKSLSPEEAREQIFGESKVATSPSSTTAKNSPSPTPKMV